MNNYLQGVDCFGPTKEASIIESSKCWMKDFCAKYGIPTASYHLFDDSETAKAYLFSLEQDQRVVIKVS